MISKSLMEQAWAERTICAQCVDRDFCPDVGYGCGEVLDGIIEKREKEADDKYDSL